MGAKNTRFWVYHPTEVPCFIKHLRMAQKTAKPLCVGSIPIRASNPKPLQTNGLHFIW